MFSFKYQKFRFILVLILLMVLLSCKLPSVPASSPLQKLPDTYPATPDTTTSATFPYQQFYTSKRLQKLIDTVLTRNYDLAIALKRIDMSRATVLQAKGLLRPQANAQLMPGIRKFGLYTMDGAGNNSTDIEKEKRVPVNLPDLYAGIQASWEVDLWGKLKSRKAAALARLLSTEEGRHILVTTLVSETAAAYYELLAEDEMLRVIDETISLQREALQTVRAQKESALANELVVQQFEAQLLSVQAMRIEVMQQIALQENRIQQLCGSWPATIERDTGFFSQRSFEYLRTGIPAQLLRMRPDIRQAEWDLVASRADLKAARAAFLPSLNIGAGIGIQGYRPGALLFFPESIAYNIASGLTMPLINRSQIKAEYAKASAQQGEALLQFERIVNRSYLEVDLGIRRMQYLDQLVSLKRKQQEVLDAAATVSAELFRTGRATYLEVLLTRQNEVTTSMDLIRARRDQYLAAISLYRSLGGGWR